MVRYTVMLHQSPAPQINRGNWDPDEQFYRVDDRVAWYDRYSRNWIVYNIDGQGHQVGSAEFYANATHLLANEQVFAK